MFEEDHYWPVAAWLDVLNDRVFIGHTNYGDGFLSGIDKYNLVTGELQFVFSGHRTTTGTEFVFDPVNNLLYFTSSAGVGVIYLDTGVVIKDYY